MAMNRYLRMTLRRYLVVLLEKFDLNWFRHLNYFEFHLQLIHFHLVVALESTKNKRCKIVVKFDRHYDTFHMCV